MMKFIVYYFELFIIISQTLKNKITFICTYIVNLIFEHAKSKCSIDDFTYSSAIQSLILISFHFNYKNRNAQGCTFLNACKDIEIIVLINKKENYLTAFLTAIRESAEKLIFSKVVTI